MTITTTWAVSQIDCYPEHEGLINVAFTVHWRCEATDGEHSGSCYGTVGLSAPPSGTFTPFEDLTLPQVLSWAHEALGDDTVAAHEAAVAKQIADQIDPPISTPPLPWSAA